MFWGTETGRVDAKGRLKLSASLHRSLRERCDALGRAPDSPDREGAADVFVTSFDGEEIKVFPSEEWARILKQMASGDTATDGAANNRLLMRANSFGKPENLDNQGRLLLPAALRKKTDFTGPVMIQWRNHHLVVWREETFERQVANNAPTSGDLAYGASTLGL
ncbi:MAG: hypothetical protein F4X12_02880 [Acidobacteriia bacterium]|nr:hypothetical protein [Terriglobia bacterium]